MRRPGLHAAALAVTLGTVAALAAPASAFAQPAAAASAPGTTSGARPEVVIEHAALDRLAAAPADAEAWATLVRLALTTTDDARRKALRARIEDCAKQQPGIAVCHYGIGALLYQESGTMGMAMRGSRIRDELARALELDPLLFAARVSLVQFYLEAGRLAGGSVEKAQGVAADAAARQPDHARFLSAWIFEHDGRLDAAAQELSAVQPGDDRELADLVHAHWASLAEAWMAKKEPAKAREVYERFVKERPTDPAPRLDLVRALVQMKEYDAAAAQLEGMRKLPGASTLALDYRLGLVWQAKGDAGQARAAYMRYLASAASNRDPASRDDAQSRLDDLR
jgi:tetratricopeptide (TPR) repeat protein